MSSCSWPQISKQMTRRCLRFLTNLSSWFWQGRAVDVPAITYWSRSQKWEKLSGQRIKSAPATTGSLMTSQCRFARDAVRLKQVFWTTDTRRLWRAAKTLNSSRSTNMKRTCSRMKMQSIRLTTRFWGLLLAFRNFCRSSRLQSNGAYWINQRKLRTK